MPINSFENYPMSWVPDKTKLTSPIYLSIAKLLEQDIRSGNLAGNTKLPPQRELADFLDLNLSTITRAFKICENKGLIYANIGQGTFVSPNAAIPSFEKGENNSIELSVIKPYYQFNTIVVDTAKRILQRDTAHYLFGFDHSFVSSFHKEIARKWLQTFHVNAEPDHIILAAGTQNGLTIAFLALFHAGDKIITDTFTYSNFIGLAKQLNIQLISVAADADGMIPDLLEKQCRLMDIKGIFLMPSCNNPTGAAMSMERKEAIARLIQEYNLILIEDDAYGFISNQADTPMQALIPNHTVYLHSLSKSLSAGLRCAYMVIPDCFKKVFLDTANNVNLKVPLLGAEIISELIVSGDADKIIKQKKAQAKERNSIYKKFFPEHISSNVYSFFQWLPLPSVYNGYQLEMQAKDNGIQIFCSDRFLVGKAEQTAIRIATCSPDSSEQLEQGLRILHHLLTKNEEYISQSNFII